MSQPPPFPPELHEYLKPRSRFRGLIGWILFGGLAVALFFLLQRGPFVTLPLSDLKPYLEQARIKELIIDGDEITGTLKAAVTVDSRTTDRFRIDLPSGMGSNWVFVEWLLDHRGNATVTVEKNPTILMTIIVPLIPWILIFGFIWFFVFRQLRKSGQTQPSPWPVYVVNQPPPPPPTSAP